MSIAAVIVCSVFNSYMRIQELRELSFKTSYLPLGYPTFFSCVFLSHRSFSFRLPHQGRDSEMQGFSGKILPVGLEIFLAKQEA